MQFSPEFACCLFTDRGEEGLQLSKTAPALHAEGLRFNRQLKDSQAAGDGWQSPQKRKPWKVTTSQSWPTWTDGLTQYKGTFKVLIRNTRNIIQIGFYLDAQQEVDLPSPSKVLANKCKGAERWLTQLEHLHLEKNQPSKWATIFRPTWGWGGEGWVTGREPLAHVWAGSIVLPPWVRVTNWCALLFCRIIAGSCFAGIHWTLKKYKWQLPPDARSRFFLYKKTDWRWEQRKELICCFFLKARDQASKRGKNKTHKEPNGSQGPFDEYHSSRQATALSQGSTTHCRM